VYGDSRAIVRWDGQRWTNDTRTILPPPHTDPVHDRSAYYLNGITALANDDVWVVGSYWDGYFVGGYAPAVPFVLHWDGFAWSKAAAPTISGDGTVLYGVAAVSSGELWAVGSHGPGGIGMDNHQTFILHYIVHAVAGCTG
jgi:hypothetical protein